jgi:hypothetical protein
MLNSDVQRLLLVLQWSWGQRLQRTDGRGSREVRPEEHLEQCLVLDSVHVDQTVG